MNSTSLIVMLTQNDRTAENADEIFECSKNSKARFWGMKEDGLSPQKMKKLYTYMKECGKTTVLEVVAYTEEECIQGAKMAIEYNCDILMGTLFFDSVNELCKQHSLKYMPFVGTVEERPSVLSGGIDEMIEQAKSYISKGVYGIDLLGYRYKEDQAELINRFVKEVNAPVCIAGSIDSYSRLDEIITAAPLFFTIGSAFFENNFDGSFPEQIDKVCDYIKRCEPC